MKSRQSFYYASSASKYFLNKLLSQKQKSSISKHKAKAVRCERNNQPKCKPKDCEISDSRREESHVPGKTSRQMETKN